MTIHFGCITIATNDMIGDERWLDWMMFPNLQPVLPLTFA